jgi:glutamate synthase (NADPH/NADH) small chain
VKAQKMKLGLADSSGRAVPKPVEGSDLPLKADIAILALGFDPEDLPDMFAAPELLVSPAGTVKIDFRRFETSLPGVFAAGDIVRGASLVVWAIRDGRDAAEAIHDHITSRAAAQAAAAE